MKRLFPLFALVLVVGCNKPSDEMCRKAIRNMRSLLGTDSPTNQTDIAGDVRRCKGGSTKKAVECAAKATSVDELRACDFMKVPHKQPSGSAEGSSTTSPPPAGSGSATTGSAGAPTMTGSDSGSATGSASGSAATGSAATGSAAGSATGSAAGSATGSAAGSAK